MTTINETLTTLESTALTGESVAIELSEEQLDTVAGGAHQASGSNYNKHKLAMSGKTFAGPEGSGSSFEMKEEDIQSSSFEMQDDL
jgi:hypothetical protein